MGPCTQHPGTGRLHSQPTTSLRGWRKGPRQPVALQHPGPPDLPRHHPWSLVDKDLYLTALADRLLVLLDFLATHAHTPVPYGRKYWKGVYKD
ncbi:hypothetical protein LY76DRAFT_597554 [Colletotrichum caudatum]|nr:hypothetical protein LY76DRAFT_597554 [Colletotrichum caudatum]